MSEFDYKPNSHKFREEQRAEKSEKPVEKKNIEKVVTGSVKTKKNDVRKLTDIFIAEDVSNVKSFVVFDVLIPTIKKAISDIVTNGVDILLFGEAGRSGKKHSSDRIQYTRYSEKPRDRDYSSARVRTACDYDDIVFNTRGEAERALSQMDDIIDAYGVVSIADLYEMADLAAPHTYQRYGWSSLRNAEAVRVRDGYMLKLPKALPID